jgi:hypothetical protein
MIASTVFIPNTVASHTNIGTLNYLETKIFQVQGNLTLIFDNSDTGTQDITITNLGYVISTNKTVVQAKSNNITYDWSFVNNTKNYNYFDLFTNNTYTISVNYQSIHVPKSPTQLLIEMLNAKNATIALMNTTISMMNHTIANITKNNTDLKNINVNLSALANETRANNTPLHMEIINLTAENTRLDGSIISLRNSIIFSNTTLGKQDKTIKELRDPWCTGYTYADVGYIYLNGASMVILFVILLVISIIFVYRKKIKQKGTQAVKNTFATTSQSQKDSTGFIDEETKDYETTVLKEEKRKEVEDELYKMKKKDPEQFQKIRQSIDKMNLPKTQPKTIPPAVRKPNPIVTQRVEYVEPDGQNNG